MAKKLRVHYFPKKCIGQGNCAAVAPAHFTLSNHKAILQGGVYHSLEEYHQREIQGDEQAMNKVIEAGLACPANAIRIIDAETNHDLVTVTVEQEKAKEVVAQYDDEKEFILDPCGYFLIRVDRQKKLIEVGFCNGKNKMVLKVVGERPIDIYSTILNKENLPLRKDHAAYLGRELQKAYLALQQNIQYVQDDELDAGKKAS